MLQSANLFYLVRCADRTEVCVFLPGGGSQKTLRLGYIPITPTAIIPWQNATLEGAQYALNNGRFDVHDADFAFSSHTKRRLAQALNVAMEVRVDAAPL